MSFFNSSLCPQNFYPDSIICDCPKSLQIIVRLVNRIRPRLLPSTAFFHPYFANRSSIQHRMNTVAENIFKKTKIDIFVWGYISLVSTGRQPPSAACDCLLQALSYLNTDFLSRNLRTCHAVMTRTALSMSYVGSFRFAYLNLRKRSLFAEATCKQQSFVV